LECCFRYYDFFAFNYFLIFFLQINLLLGDYLETLNGHNRYVNALTLLPNGLLASGSDDEKIMIWNVSETSRLYTLSGHTGAIRGLTVINNEYLASCSDDKTIKLWSLSNYEEVNSWIPSDFKSNALAFDRILNVLVSGADDNKTRVWDSRLWTNITTKPGECFKKQRIPYLLIKLTLRFF
jgi:WD40 repeat protein